MSLETRSRAAHGATRDADSLATWRRVLDRLERTLDAHADHLRSVSESDDDTSPPPPVVFTPPADIAPLPAELHDRALALHTRIEDLTERARTAMSALEPAGGSARTVRPRSASASGNRFDQVG